MSATDRSQKQNIERLATIVGSKVSRSSSGDIVTGSKIAKISLNAINNLIPANGRTFTGLGGTVTAADRHFVCNTGTTIFAYAALQSFRSITYREGQGASVRFAAKYATGVASSWVGCGMISIGDEIAFGYNGEAFGTWHRHGGLAEVQTLTVTGAAGGAESATLTLNDEVYTIPLSASTAQTNASEIAAYLNANSTTWAADQVDDAVIISASSDGDKTGAFSFSSATATASLAETTAGVTKTSDFTAQTDWNGEYPNGFDPTKGNNYEIKYSNGYGRIEYYIDDMDDGEYKLAHTVKWGNNNTTANFGNPSMRLGCYAYSIGSTTDIEVQCGYLTGFIDGDIQRTRNPRALGNTKSIATTNTNILTLRNRRTINGLINQSEILPIEVILANDGTKNAIFEVRGNPTVGGIQNFQEAGNNLLSDYDTAGTTVSGGRLFKSVPVAKSSSVTIDLNEIAMPPSLQITISGSFVSGSSNDLSASLDWYEDI